jgi:hypothetical protein|tara:strand:- start:405 stop:629 length:225 start_codon:yes stop_codon:yes gene_type:complete
MRRKVVITNQDTFIEWNLTRIIKSFYPLLDDLQVSILAEDLKKDGDWDFFPDEIHKVLIEYCYEKGITLEDYAK